MPWERSSHVIGESSDGELVLEFLFRRRFILEFLFRGSSQPWQQPQEVDSAAILLPQVKSQKFSIAYLWGLLPHPRFSSPKTFSYQASSGGWAFRRFSFSLARVFHFQANPNVQECFLHYVLGVQPTLNAECLQSHPTHVDTHHDPSPFVLLLRTMVHQLIYQLYYWFFCCLILGF